MVECLVYLRGKWKVVLRVAMKVAEKVAEKVVVRAKRMEWKWESPSAVWKVYLKAEPTAAAMVDELG